MLFLSSHPQENWQGNLGLVIKTAGSRLLSVHLRKKLNQLINQQLDPLQIDKIFVYKEDSPKTFGKLVTPEVRYSF